MAKDSISAVLCLILALSVLTSVNPNPLLTACSPTNSSNNSYIKNSPFEQNLNILLQFLTLSTPLTGYNDTSIGDGSNQVYGQSLCRGDVDATDCQKCLENASQGIIKCQTKEAIIWYEVCQIHYSSLEFRKLMVYAGQKPSQNYHRRNVTQSNQFRKTWIELITNLSNKATSKSEKIFASGNTKYPNGNIYGLVQCTRDITRRNCRSCLSSALGDLQGFFPSGEGGIILSGNCNVRFEIYPFYNTSNSEGN